jgi:hypothetical protein
MGKTRLFQEVRRLAAAEGAGADGARQPANGPSAWRGPPLFEAPWLTRPTGPTCCVVGGRGDVGVRGHRQRRAGGLADGSFAILHGLYWLTVNLAGDPAQVLAVDDLQWCDPLAAGAGFPLGRLEGLPVLIAATLRTGEQHPDEELIAELAEDPATVVVHPDR